MPWKPWKHHQHRHHHMDRKGDEDISQDTIRTMLYFMGFMSNEYSPGFVPPRRCLDDLGTGMHRQIRPNGHNTHKIPNGRRIRTIRDCDKIILEFYIEQTRASLLLLRSYRHIFLFILCFIYITYITYIYLRLGVLNQCATNLCTFILLWRERA